MTAPRLVPATVPAASVLAALHRSCFADPWDEAVMAEMLAMPGVFGWIAGHGEAPAGFILVRAAGGEAEILSIGVIPAARRRGLARALLDTALKATRAAGATALFLEAAEDNKAAKRLYEQAAFETVGRRPAYYARPGGAVAACIMRRALTSTPLRSA